jgi:predicted DNA-binding transcriptional regulator AlpA
MSKGNGRECMKTIRNDMPRLLRDKQFAELLSISRSYLWRLVKCGKIPAPIKLGPKTTVWKSDDVIKVVERPELYFKE